MNVRKCEINTSSITTTVRIKESFSKRGIQRGIHEFKKKHNHITKLKIKLTFIIISRSIIDRFGIKPNCGNSDRNAIRGGIRGAGRGGQGGQYGEFHGGGFEVEPIRKACVIYNDMTSERRWDFIRRSFHPKQKVDCCEPLLTVNSVNGGWQLQQFIYTLLYSYAFTISVPITYAKHYAKSFSKMIFQRDKTELIDSGEYVRNPKGKRLTIIRKDPHQMEQDATAQEEDMSMGGGAQSNINDSVRTGASEQDNKSQVPSQSQSPANLMIIAQMLIMLLRMDQIIVLKNKHHLNKHKRREISKHHII